MGFFYVFLAMATLECVWIVAKVHLTKILVMTQRLVFVWMVAIFFEVLVMTQKWMVAIFLACQ